LTGRCSATRSPSSSGTPGQPGDADFCLRAAAQAEWLLLEDEISTEQAVLAVHRIDLAHRRLNPAACFHAFVRRRLTDLGHAPQEVPRPDGPPDLRVEDDGAPVVVAPVASITGPRSGRGGRRIA
jgi:hypothetical protein